MNRGIITISETGAVTMPDVPVSLIVMIPRFMIFVLKCLIFVAFPCLF